MWKSGVDFESLSHGWFPVVPPPSARRFTQLVHGYTVGTVAVDCERTGNDVRSESHERCVIVSQECRQGTSSTIMTGV